MNGFGPFLCGAVLGGASVFASLSYHFVQSKQGFLTIPKLSPTFTETYVDTRQFTVTDWQQRKGLTAAVLRANHGAIIGEGIVDQAAEAARGFLPEFSQAPAGQQQR
jgi:hypothetical protein